MFFLHRFQPPFLQALRSFSSSPKLIHSPSSEPPSGSRSSRRRVWQSSFFFSSQENSHGLEAGVPFLPPSLYSVSLFFSLRPQWLWNLYVLLPRESRPPLSSFFQGEAGCSITLCQSREEALIEWSGRGEERCHRCKQAQSPDLNSNRVSSMSAWVASLFGAEPWVKAVLHTMSQCSERGLGFLSTGGSGKVRVAEEGIRQVCLGG